jgi:hypothetical protein
MKWIILAIILFLAGLIFTLLGAKPVGMLACTAFIIVIIISTIADIGMNTYDLDRRGEITWSNHSVIQQNETLVSVNRLLQDNSYVCYVKASSGELIERSYSDRDIKIMDNPKEAGKIETRDVTGTVKPDEWWNSFASGTREKEVYYIYPPNNKINLVSQCP